MADHHAPDPRHRLGSHQEPADRRWLSRDPFGDRLFRHVGRHDADGLDDLRLHAAVDCHRHSDRHSDVSVRSPPAGRQPGARRHADDAELRLSDPRRHAAGDRQGSGPHLGGHLRDTADDQAYQSRYSPRRQGRS
ncbi:hypothetical protein D9M70_572710 [compost metagenome]